MTRIYYSFLCSLLVASNNIQVGLAQQKPFLQVDKFDDTRSYRTNVCERQTQLYQNLIDTSQALEGLNLTVAFTHYTEPYEDKLFNLDGNGRIPENRPGLFVVIMDELAKRAGFNWRDSFVAIEPIEPEKDDRNWTDMLEWTINTFDIAVDGWAKSVPRMAKGIAFPEGWMDYSLIMVERVDLQSEKVNMFSFLTPFHFMVWVMVFVTIVVTGLVYWILERLNRDSDQDQLESKPMTVIFLSCMAFTGHFDFHPGTHSARLLSLSFTFFILIIVSAYTANLASFLVANQTPQFKVNTLAQAMRHDVPVCIQSGSNQDEILAEQYPELKLVRRRFEGEVFQALKNGECTVAVTPVSSYEVYVRTNTINKDCNLKSDKKVIQILSAGFATAIDSGANCTSLIDNIIDLHMTEMIADGFIEQAWNTHLTRVGDASCLAQDEANFRDNEMRGGVADEENVSLSLEEMSGIFMFHAALSTIALVIALVRFFLVRREPPRKMIEKLGIADQEPTGTNDTGGPEKDDDQSSSKPSKGQTGVDVRGPNAFWDP